MSGSVTSPRPTALQYLQSLEDAYFQLVRGGMVATITDENLESVTYSKTDMPTMLSLMQQLQQRCPTYQSPLLPDLRRTHRAIGFIF
ncbi:MAG: hypothetical protein ACRYGR_00480 [Janthinobacterium lividum]